MKKYLASLAIVSSLFAQTSIARADAFNCGEWTDVSDEHLEILTAICEYGLMQGHSENDYGYNDPMLRAELAVVVNRLVYGEDTYDDLGQNQEEYAEYLSNLMVDWFTDIPDTSTYSNEWIIKAMYYSSVELGIMSGDGTSKPTTYRPVDGVNIVETFKILYEGAYEGELLAADVPTSIEYDWTPWWEELMSYMEDEEVIYNLDTDYQSFWLSSPLTVSYSDFASAIDREDAAIFLYYMIQAGVIDEDKLGTPCFDEPCGSDGL